MRFARQKKTDAMIPTAGDIRAAMEALIAYSDVVATLPAFHPGTVSSHEVGGDGHERGTIDEG